MFRKIISATLSVLLVVLIADANSGKSLDSVHNQYQEKDAKTEQRRTTAEIKATLIPRPEGYENSKNWTRASALRLMYLLRGNKTAKSIQQTLKNILASSIAASGSGVKFRRTEELSVLKIDNHLQLNLPSARVDLKTLIDLLPKRTLSWLSSFGSANTPPPKGPGEVHNGGYGSSIKDFGRYSIGGSRGHSGYGIGGSGGHSHYGIGGSAEQGGYSIGGTGGYSHYGIGGSVNHSHYGIGGSGESGGYGIGESSSTSDEGASSYGIGGSSSGTDGDSSSYGIGGWEDDAAILDLIAEHFGTPNNSYGQTGQLGQTGKPGLPGSANLSFPVFGISRGNYGSLRKPSGPGRQ